MDPESSIGNSYLGRPLSSEAAVSTTPSTSAYVRSVAPAPGGNEQSDEDKAFDLFNLINLSFEFERGQKIPVPQLYRQPQAVDTGKELGHGASFTVYRRAIPEHIPRQVVSDMGTWTVTQTERKEKRPAFVVFKVPRISLNERGEPDQATRHAMKSVLTEMYALTYKPLMEHPNIVDFLGLAWVSSVFDNTVRIPALMVEYADCGTLADVQASVTLTVPERFDLCTDVANGLEMLHRTAIFHGDLKSENVLVFSSPDPKRRYTAKLADFGFSILGTASNEYNNIGGTRPWQAPEAKQTIARHFLVATDQYSFGLLLWRVVAGISNPFKLISPPETPDGQLLAYAESLKRQDDFHALVHVDNWSLPSVQTTDGSTDQLSATQKLQASDLRAVISVLRSTKYPSISLPANHGEGPLLEVEMTLGQLFDTVADCCLQKDPSKRIMRVARSILRQRQGISVAASMAAPILPQLQFNSGDKFPSWEKISHLDADLQATIRNALRARFIHRYERNMIQATECIMTAALSVNGQGLDVNYLTASRMLSICAKNGHQISQAYCYRIVKAVGFLETLPVDMSWIGIQASLGSRAAMEELADWKPDVATDYRQKNRDWKGGVGGNFYSSYNMLHGMSLTDWLAIFDNPVALKAKIEQLGNVASIKVNKEWGDSPLHMAAACGKAKAVSTLLTTYKGVLDVNLLNEQNETPLFCACRAGQPITSLVLLALGADPKISKKRGETPLHWMISFEPEHVKNVGSMLIRRGADILALTTEDISYTIFPSGLDYDHKPPGSTLLWAVHENRPDVVRLLLSQKDGLKLPLLKHGNRQNALDQAAYFHFHECLKLMTDALDEANVVYSYSDLVWSAVRGGNRFSMMIRNGSQWKQRMTTTMMFVMERARGVVASLGMDQRGSTVLYEAVRGYLVEIVEVLLQHGLHMTEEFHAANNANTITEHERGPMVIEPGVIRQKHINLIRGEEGRSPLLEALHTNQKPVFEMLMQHGADPLQNGRNPFSHESMNWTALHVFAHARPVYNLDLVGELVRAGVPIDGIQEDGLFTCETPFMAAVAVNAFQVASTLIEFGCDVNAVTTAYGFTELGLPTTLLGHIAAASSRNSTARLRYLLRDNPKANEISFIVEPDRELTALHRIAMGPNGVYPRGPEILTQTQIPTEDYDFAANREICYELLQHFSSPEQIDKQDLFDKRTALMVAVQNDNAAVVKLLAENGARSDIQDRQGRTVFDMALEKRRSVALENANESERPSKRTAREDVWDVLMSLCASSEVLAQFQHLDLD